MLSSRLIRRLRDERGISMIMALGTTLALSLTTAGMIQYTSGGVKHAASDNAGTTAYQLAEEGINNALATLNNQLDPDTGENTGIPVNDPASADVFWPPSPVNNSKIHWTHPEVRGSVDVTGELVIDEDAEEEYLWTITSTGTVTTGTTVRKRTLSRSVAVQGLNSGADASSWSRFYQDDPSTCLTINTVNFPTAVATRGDLCLINGGSVTGIATTVNAGGNVFISGPNVTSSVNYPDLASGTTWATPTGVNANGGTYATYPLGANATTNTLAITDFDFAIPSNAIIRGIRVEIEHRAPSRLRRRPERRRRLPDQDRNHDGRHRPRGDRLLVGRLRRELHVRQLVRPLGH